MSEECRWLHEQLEQLPPVRFPFRAEQLPTNGIYFFYETGEIWGHGGDKPRIIRIGTHKDRNFRSRIAEHFLLNPRKMEFNKDEPKPSDRSIFRKNIGRAILKKANDPYLEVWEIDFIKNENRERYAWKRDIKKERKTEEEITWVLREKFCFRCITINGETLRMGNTGLESSLIATVAQCGQCRPSPNWLGKHSPVEKIRER